MSENSYPEMLRRLCNEYYQRHIGFEEYRAQRKSILDKIDEVFNGRKFSAPQIDESESLARNMGTIAFFNNTDIDT